MTIHFNFSYTKEYLKRQACQQVYQQSSLQIVNGYLLQIADKFFVFGININSFEVQNDITIEYGIYNMINDVNHGMS